MSEMVHYKGTLYLIPRLNETLEEQCKKILGNVELDEDYNYYEKMLLHTKYKEYIIYDDKLYSIKKNSLDPDANFFTANRITNGIINFEVRYYNGGTSFDEAIEYAFENMK